jgi:hypothetical protein
MVDDLERVTGTPIAELPRPYQEVAAEALTPWRRLIRPRVGGCHMTHDSDARVVELALEALGPNATPLALAETVASCQMATD